ncbi:MAG: hypothetical protein K9H62_19860 [Bacteroidales bacterium]|nr:hypothetical protein [Bacteroidales bacterium]
MSISKKEILHKTHYGLTIYAHVLREFYPCEIAISLSGKESQLCKNPFRNDEPNLRIFNQDSVFYFEDTENKNFQGDPFDFAALYFQVGGNELLVKINKELYLRIDDKHRFHYRKETTIIHDRISMKPKPTIPVFSYYRRPVTNIRPYGKLNLLEIYKLIRGKNFQQETGTLRGLTQK